MTEDDSDQAISFSYNTTAMESEEDWEDFKESMDEQYKEGENTEITVDGYSAYKVHQTGENEYYEGDSIEVTSDLIYIYEDTNNIIHILMYVGIEDNYNEELSEKIVDKFELR
ncbi:MAG: hypothetical protein ACOC1K_02480 [Nanoarchaeota archaeon]